MICAGCQRGFNSTEEKKRVEIHLVNGKEVAYGYNVPEHPLEAAHGPIQRVYHRKHWFAMRAHNTVVAARAADPSRSDREPQDWRPQVVADVEDMISEGHRDY